MTASTPPISKRTIRLAPYILALLCFLLPFVEVSCQGQKLASLSGFQLAMGTTVDVPDPISGQAKSQRLNDEPGIAWAFWLTVCALVLALSSFKKMKLWAALGGAGAFVSMLVAKSHMDKEILTQGGGLVSISCTFGFILACLLQIVGAVISGIQSRQPEEEE